MRKYLYLVTDDPDDELVGTIEADDRPYVSAEKGVETTHRMWNRETGERWERKLVSLGYCDYEDQDEYEDEVIWDAREKLADIDAELIENAGLDPEEVVPAEVADA